MRLVAMWGSTEIAGRTSYVGPTNAAWYLIIKPHCLKRHSLLCRFCKPKYLPYFIFAISLHALFSSLHHHVANQVPFRTELGYQA